MGRHSGFLGSALTLALTAAAISRIIADADGSLPSAGPTGERREAAVSGRVRTEPVETVLSCNPQNAVEPNDNQRSAVTTVFHVPVPAGGFLVIGSLDISGAPHIIRIASRQSRRAEPSDIGNPCLTTTFKTACVRNSSEEHNGAPVVMRNPLHEVRLQTDGFSSTADEVTSKVEVEKVTQIRTQVVSDDRKLSTSAQRSFLAPHFEAATIIHEPTLARMIASSDRVAVYLDNGLLTSGQYTNAAAANDETVIIDSARRICSTIETELADRIYSWIHPIADLDDDGHLTILITDLDRRDQPDVTPVLGCVRDSDFQQFDSIDFGGDIVYLDYRLPEGDELTALLAHELTHAAIASLQLELRAETPGTNHVSVQPWMNEAAAHWVELCFCSEPTGFSNRLRHFQADTASCPIVACQSHVPLSTRRAGSRISGASFLRRVIEHPEQLRQLLHDGRPLDEALSRIAGKPFEELFRTWSAEQAALVQASSNSRVHSVVINGTIASRIHGTSFILVRCDEMPCELIIESEETANLQVTVLTN